MMKSRRFWESYLNIFLITLQSGSVTKNLSEMKNPNLSGFPLLECFLETELAPLLIYYVNIVEYCSFNVSF